MFNISQFIKLEATVADDKSPASDHDGFRYRWQFGTYKKITSGIEEIDLSMDEIDVHVKEVAKELEGAETDFLYQH